MQQLSDSLRAIAKENTVVATPEEAMNDLPLQAARAWADHALQTYTGDLLVAALAVSSSLANFSAELYLKGERSVK